MTDPRDPLTPRRSRPSGAAALLWSPSLTFGMAGVIVILVVAIIALPAILAAPQPTPNPTATPGCPPVCPSPTPAPTPTVEPTFVRPTPSPAPTFMTYVVRSGDTLTSIAREFRTSARSIAWWNRGTYPSLDPESESYAPNRIEVGWSLVLIPGMTVDETSPPTPSPGPTGTPGPTFTLLPTFSPAPTATPAGDAAATVVTHGGRKSGKIALTFDMGGRLDPASDIVTWLIDHNVPATIFPTGLTGSTTEEGIAALQLAAAHPELFDFGNHSWDHPDFRELTAAQIADQLLSTENALYPLLGQSTKPWFRPPYGGWNDRVRTRVGDAGWAYLVMWDVDTIDWRPVADGGPTAADIVAKVAADARGGSIVLMHLGGYHTLAALPGILAAIEAKGLTPVTLTELLGS
jgi:peptidoglycan/xylan/chitin deacetylase (PgdA/CDA1 family)